MKNIFNKKDFKKGYINSENDLNFYLKRNFSASKLLTLFDFSPKLLQKVLAFSVNENIHLN